MSEHRYGVRDCASCGRRIDLDRHGCYRRHYASGPDGHRHLCEGSGRAAAGVVQLLAVEPTQHERHSHVLQMLDPLDP